MKLIIPKEVEARLHDYVMSVDSEIAGMGRVSVSEDGETVTVEEVMIYEQEVTGATADLSPQAIARWQSDLVKAGGSPKHWKLWWHSHHTMAAFFSGTDTATMDRQSEGDWMMSLVVNVKRERKARLDMYRPFRMFLDDVDIQIGEEEETYQVPASIAEEVALKVKRRAITTHAGYGKHYTGYTKYSPGAGYGQIESIETPSTYAEVKDNIKALEQAITDYENVGQGETEACTDLYAELVDLYYDLADKERDAVKAMELQAKAVEIEGNIYDLEEELSLGV